MAKYTKPHFIGIPKTEDVNLSVSATGASTGRDARNSGPWKIHAPAHVNVHIWFHDYDKQQRRRVGSIELSLQDAREFSQGLVRMCEAAERMQAEAEAKVAAQED